MTASPYVRNGITSETAAFGPSGLLSATPSMPQNPPLLPADRAPHAQNDDRRGEACPQVDMQPRLHFAYAFQHPNLASIVFGASTPEQLDENVAAWSTFEALDDEQRAAVMEIAR